MKTVVFGLSTELMDGFVGDSRDLADRWIDEGKEGRVMLFEDLGRCYNAEIKVDVPMDIDALVKADQLVDAFQAGWLLNVKVRVREHAGFTWAGLTQHLRSNVSWVTGEQHLVNDALCEPGTVLTAYPGRPYLPQNFSQFKNVILVEAHHGAVLFAKYTTDRRPAVVADCPQHQEDFSLYGKALKQAIEAPLAAIERSSKLAVV